MLNAGPDEKGQAAGMNRLAAETAARFLFVARVVVEPPADM
jgi:hypothetical protein